MIARTPQDSENTKARNQTSRPEDGCKTAAACLRKAKLAPPRLWPCTALHAKRIIGRYEVRESGWKTPVEKAGNRSLSSVVCRLSVST